MYVIGWYFVECPSGISCDSTIAGHFRRFRHTLLANARAGVCDVMEEEPGNREIHTQVMLNTTGVLTRVLSQSEPLMYNI